MLKSYEQAYGVIVLKKNGRPKSYNCLDSEEISKFAPLAQKWWEPSGPFQALHAINVPRVKYIRDNLYRSFKIDPHKNKPLSEISIIDVGCGGGLTAEPLARLGAKVTAIDAEKDTIKAAKFHASKSELSIDYRHTKVEHLLSSKEQFDCVIALEIIEHINDLNPFLESLCKLLLPDGVIFISTLNRTLSSYLLGIVFAERILRWVPNGMHDWSRFVRPSELIYPLRYHEVHVKDVSGLSYNPLSGDWFLSKKLKVNYITFGVRKSTI